MSGANRLLDLVHVGERLARWMVKPENARTIARQAASALAAGAQVLNEEDVQELIDHTLEERVPKRQLLDAVELYQRMVKDLWKRE